MEADPLADPFEGGLTRKWRAIAHTHAGQPEQAMELYTEMMARGGPAHVYGISGLVLLLAALGEATRRVPSPTTCSAAARGLGNPFFVAYTLYAFGLAFARSDPSKAQDAFTQGLAYATEHRQVLVKASIARYVARLEHVHGDLARSLDLYDLALDVQHGSGNVANLVPTLTSLAVGLRANRAWTGSRHALRRHRRLVDELRRPNRPPSSTSAGRSATRSSTAAPPSARRWGPSRRRTDAHQQIGHARAELTKPDRMAQP